ncbi:hypothetical protein lerEdw1_010678 [Lerista edwardsae]|nr:hypothetical protein lerEdw1_010678 [Lerista edwardsae]
MKAARVPKGRERRGRFSFRIPPSMCHFQLLGRELKTKIQIPECRFDSCSLLREGRLNLHRLGKMNKDAQMKATINQKLIETGERERLKELLRAKLIECGWKDQLKAHCKDVIKEKGLEHVTVDDLVAEITPKGRALVPDSVKKELLQRIRTFLAQHASL